MKPDFEKMNGLVPAVVQDVKTKQVLMLAYVNEEAYEKMLETGDTWFYSRSRNKLWHKGEESGHFQHIKGLYLDCKKVGEEATETVIAAKNTSKEDLIGEIGDLYYHVLVLMNAYGLTVDDVLDKLKERHKVTGNKKEFHTRGEI